MSIGTDLDAALAATEGVASAAANQSAENQGDIQALAEIVATQGVTISELETRVEALENNEPPAPTTGLLIVTTTTPASIYLDISTEPSGTAAPDAPLSLELPPGDHAVRAEADGFTDASDTATIASETTTELRLVLEEIPEPEPTIDFQWITSNAVRQNLRYYAWGRPDPQGIMERVNHGPLALKYTVADPAHNGWDSLYIERTGVTSTSNYVLIPERDVIVRVINPSSGVLDRPDEAVAAGVRWESQPAGESRPDLMVLVRATNDALFPWVPSPELAEFGSPTPGQPRPPEYAELFRVPSIVRPGVFNTWHDAIDRFTRVRTGHEHGTDPELFSFFGAEIGATGIPWYPFWFDSLFTAAPGTHSANKIFGFNLTDSEGVEWEICITVRLLTIGERRWALERFHPISIVLGREGVIHAHLTWMADFGRADATYDGNQHQPLILPDSNNHLIDRRSVGEIAREFQSNGWRRIVVAGLGGYQPSSWDSSYARALPIHPEAKVGFQMLNRPWYLNPDAPSDGTFTDLTSVAEWGVQPWLYATDGKTTPAWYDDTKRWNAVFGLAFQDEGNNGLFFTTPRGDALTNETDGWGQYVTPGLDVVFPNEAGGDHRVFTASPGINQDSRSTWRHRWYSKLPFGGETSITSAEKGAIIVGETVGG